LKLRDDRPRGVVPGGGRVAGLLAQVDTQDNGFWFEIRAWGWGANAESWQVREGFVLDEDALIEVLFMREGKPVYYRDPEGRKYHVVMAVIDAMGHRTKEVYDLCRRFRRRLIPLQGVDKLQGTHNWTTLEYYPPDSKGRKRPIAGGLQLLRVNTTYYKDGLSTILVIAPGDPGCWYFHKETGRDWAYQMTVEYINDKGLWECPESKPNHAWDVSCYGLACYEISGLWAWTREAEGQPEEEAAGSKSKSKPQTKKRW
jgi:phage terminase large subunit GpA-like protein